MGTIQIDGSTPKITVGNATAEDATILFDGNAQDFYIALDDSADDLLIGKGSTVGTTPAIAIDENLKVNIPVTTASTSASTGSLTTGGGAGIGADLYVGDDAYLITDSAVLGFGADKDTLLTHTDGTGLTLNSTNKLCFNDASQFVQGSSATVLSIGATDEIDLTATAVDLNGTLNVSGVATFQATPVFPDGSLALADLDIDGGTDIGAAIVDADLFIVDDGAGGTNRKVTASRIKTYAGGGDLSFGGDTFGADKTIGANDDYDLTIETNNTARLLITNDGELATGGETAPDNAPGGLCLDDNANDGQMFSFKNSDVAHGLTDYAETDTYAWFMKHLAASGGLRISGIAQGGAGTKGIELFAIADASAVHDAESTSAPGTINFNIYKDDGSVGATALSADQNMFTVATNDVVEFIVKGDGELFSNQSATVGTYDEYDDAQLVRAVSLSSNPKAVIDSKFDKWVKYNAADLVKAGIRGKDDDGNPTSFINVTGLQRLHNGAIWQQYEKHERLLEAVYELAKEAVGEDKADAILDKHEVKRLQ
jgi:hypothetical protein